MKLLIRRCAIVAATACAALVSTSCYYDPAVYGSTGYVSSEPAAPPANYSYGFGAGYGYGHPRFSTSFFVSTGDPRWGYDPYSYSYFDYVSHRYYDPYLCGYYPYGYRPRVIYGVPHVHGYRRGYAPPPRVVNNYVITGHRDRVGAYRRSGHSWGRSAGWERPRPNVIGHRPSRNDKNNARPQGNRQPVVTGSRSSRGNNSSIQQPNRGNQNRRPQATPPRRNTNTTVTTGNRNSSVNRSQGNRNQGTRNQGNRINSPNPIGSRPQSGARPAPSQRQKAAPSGNRGRGDSREGNQRNKRF